MCRPDLRQLNDLSIDGIDYGLFLLGENFECIQLSGSGDVVCVEMLLERGSHLRVGTRDVVVVGQAKRGRGWHERRHPALAERDLDSACKRTISPSLGLDQP